MDGPPRFLPFFFAFLNRALSPLPPRKEKRKADTLSILKRSLDTAQRSLDEASARLGAVEDERAENLSRIDEASRRVDAIRTAIDDERRRTDEEVSRRVASFRRFEDEFWRKEGGALVGATA